MKKNLVKKTLLLSALFSAVVFAGCNNGSQEPSAVEEITLASVVPETKSEEAVPVTKKVFDDVVMEKLMDEFPDLVAAIAPVSSTTSNKRAAVTMDELQDSFKKFKDSFTITLSEDSTSGSVKGNWQGPLGEIDYEDNVKGLSTTINAMRVSVDASFNTSTAGMTGNANGSARYAASSKFTLPGTDVESCIKSGKSNVLYYLNVNNVNASVSAEKMETIMSVAGSNPDYAAVVEALNTLSGAINFYSGIDTALYFEVEDNDKLYNGVIKATVSAALNYTLSKETFAETAEKVLAIVEKYESDKDYEVTAEDLAAFNDLVSLRIDLSVYDAEGTKLFSLVDATKLDEAYTEIDSLVSSESNKK